MKTKTVERLMNETPEHTKQQVSEYADEIVQNNETYNNENTDTTT